MSTVTRGSVMGRTSPAEVTTRARPSSRRVRAGVKVLWRWAIKRRASSWR
ncbi:MAG: hypothetical protein MUC57_20250 [Desulfobacterales bacterium]|nr:hypothetical protein [Desulfobacterales bacterium]